jgi:hypothetical protein
MPEFRSIEIRSGFANAALARPSLRLRAPENKTEFRFKPIAVAPATLIRHATRSRREILEATAAMCKYDDA